MGLDSSATSADRQGKTGIRVMPNMTLRRRLFIFLLALVIMMTLSAIIILLTLEAPLIDNTREIKLSVERELSIYSRDLEARLGDTSVKLVRLSESLSKSIESTLITKKTDIENLKSRPEVLGELIENEFDRLIAAMDRAKSSGVFLILDATGTGNFRAGVSFRVSGPDLLKPEMPKRFLRGTPTPDFPDDFMMLSGWEMEFDVKDRAFYHLPLENSVSYWNLESIAADSGEPMILCSIPVIGADGKTLGVCGFEINNNFLMANCLPEAGGYRQVFCLFSVIDGNRIDIEHALFSGAGEDAMDQLSVSVGASLNAYTLPNGKKFIGQHKNIRVYPETAFPPSDPTFAIPRFVMAVLIPKEEIDSHNFRIRLRLVLLIAALLGFGTFVSLYISRRYLRPVLSTIDQLVELIQEKDDINELFTQEEIDVAMLLIEGKMRSEISRGLHLSAAETDRRIESIRGKIDIKGDSNPLVTAVTKEFRLTQRETDIFRCLLKGMTNTEISGELFISEGTVKIHVHNLLKKLELKNRQSIKNWSETFSLQKGIA